MKKKGILTRNAGRLLNNLKYLNRIFFLIFIGSLSFHFLFLNYNTIQSHSSNLISKSIESEIISEQGVSDLLVLFREKNPDIGYFNQFLIKKYHNFPVFRFTFNNNSHLRDFVKKYGKDITRIEFNQITRPSLNYNPKFDKEDRISRTMIQDSTGASFLVNQLGITGMRTKIGIIDTGVSDHLVEFGSRIKGRDVFVNRENGYSQDISTVIDIHGHGTHVAGLAAGATTGIAPEAEIYSAKIVELGVTGAGGGELEETTAGMLDAIDYLVNNSVDVINISLGQYHNLPSGIRDEVINYVSLIYNIVFSISVGNSGTSFGDRATLNNPSTALQCIAVTATNIENTAIANYASRGPKIDYSLKPDIAAPGTNLNGPSNTGSGTVKKTGTSMASAVVGGASALLIDYLKKNNISYTAATIKAALLKGTQSLGEPLWEEGAGFLNITRSWQFLNSTILINNTPQIEYLHPSQLPFEPYAVLFTGSSVEFNLTGINSIPKIITPNISSSLKEFITITKQEYLINNTTLIPINFSIPFNSTSQVATGIISIGLMNLSVSFEIRKPLRRIIFDESLNKIVRHGYTTSAYEIQGDSSTTIGMYSEFARYLSYENNYSIISFIG